MTGAMSSPCGASVAFQTSLKLHSSNLLRPPFSGPRGSLHGVPQATSVPPSRRMGKGSLVGGTREWRGKWSPDRWASGGGGLELEAMRRKGYRWGLGGADRRGVSLQQTKGEQEAAKRGGRKGFYVRPSKAVELGGGFYVPGFEGPRLRIAIGVFAVSMLLLNRFTQQDYDPLDSQVMSEGVTGVTTLLLLGQAIYELFTGEKVVSMSLGEEGAQGEEQEPDAPSVLQSNEKLSDERADEELWVISSALQVAPACTAAITLSKDGYLAACTPEVCSEASAQSAHAACVRLVDGKAAIGLERGEGGGDTDEVFSILPRGCGKALVCGVGARLLVVGMPKGVKDISGQEAVWLSQLAALPISAH